MPGTISRDGATITAPEFTPAQKRAMVQSIAKAMASLGRAEIQRAVEQYAAAQK